MVESFSWTFTCIVTRLAERGVTREEQQRIKSEYRLLQTYKTLFFSSRRLLSVVPSCILYVKEIFKTVVLC